MGRLLRGLAFAALALPIAAAAQAAESVRLRPLAPLYVDGKGAGIHQPEGVGCGGNSLLVVADTGNGRLLQYTVSGENLAPGAAIVLPQVPSPIVVQVSAGGEIFALDGRLRRIARISPAGEFQGYIDLSGAGGTVIPRSFKIGGDGNLYVLDVSSARVVVLDAAGKVQRQIPFPEDYGFFSDLAVDLDGTVYLVDSVGRRVYSAAKDAAGIAALTDSLKEELNFPTAIAVHRANLYVVDQNGSGIVILGKDGSFKGRRFSLGWKEGFLRYPSQLCVSDDGLMFIADRGNSRIEVISTAR